MSETLPTLELKQAGQSPWLDNISRELLRSGKLKALIDEKGLLGVTSNPTIFEKAISKPGGGYEADIERLIRKGAGTFEIYDALSTSDIRETCDLFRGVFEKTGGDDGFVSLEVMPALAHEEEATVQEALRLFRAVERPNVMIKVPATAEGIPAVRRLIASGVNINITLMFSTQHYRDVANAYLAGLEDLRARGWDLSKVHSVASVFVSRIDTLLDKKLETLAAANSDRRGEIEPLFGKAAVANSKLIYQEFKRLSASERFLKLQEAGARIQKVLWGSTSAKNPKYPDLIYVETLVGPETVNTLPDATLEALLDHGKVREGTIEEGREEARSLVEALKNLGIDLVEAGKQLQREGVISFANSFDSLMRTLELKREAARGKGGRAKTKITFLHPGGVKKGFGALSSAIQERIKALEKENFLTRFLAADPSLWKKGQSHQKVIQNRLGWLRVADWALGKLYEIDALRSEIKKEGFRDIVLLGMGGSSLAPEVMSQVLKMRRAARFHVLDTTEPAAISNLEKEISLKSTLFIVSSKSGSTVETQSQFRFFYDKVAHGYGKKGLEIAGRHFIAITDSGSALEKIAREQKFRRLFINPSDIGGRYSALSFFGLVPMALLGADVRAVLRSARTFLQAAEKEGSLEKNPAFALGILLGELSKAGKDKVTFWMTHSLASFGAWAEQLIAESTGKEGKGIVPVDGEEPAAPESYGKDRVFVVLKLRREKSTGLERSIRSVQKAGFPVIEMEWQDPSAIGAEFLRWEIATTVAGAIIGVNPFDEPDVQESKENTARILAKKKRHPEAAKRPKDLSSGILRFAQDDVHRPQDDVRRPQDDKLASALASFFLKLKAGGYIALLAYMERTPETQKAFRGIRAKLRDYFHAPVLLGFGPRYLHSAGQLFKGGRANGIFLEFLKGSGRNIPIPAAGYGFEELKRAQALGDYEAFRKRHIPVLLIELGKNVSAGIAAFENKTGEALCKAEGIKRKKGKMAKK